MSKNAEYQSKYDKTNKDIIAERKRKYYLANKDKLSEYQRQYRLANRDEINEKQRKSRNANNGVIHNRKIGNYKPPKKTIDACQRIMELCGLKGRVT